MVKVVPRDGATDADIDAAIEAGKNTPTYTRALSANYIADTDQITVTFDNGIEVRFPRAALRLLTDKTSEQISRVEVTDGDALRWDECDIDYYIPNMMDGFAPSCRAASAFARLGGSQKSPAKTAAVRANGKKGGRPKKRTVTA